jgi:hypothetical protein
MSTTLASDAIPPKPSRLRAIVVMAVAGFLTGIISSLPSPLPDLRLKDPDILINSEGVPLHAGIAFGAGMAIMLWFLARPNMRKCALAMGLILMGWLIAVNTANDVMTAVVSSDLFGTVAGAKASREMVGWILAGLVGGAIGGGLTAFGAGNPARAIRRPEAWGAIVLIGALFGLLLYPAAKFDLLALLLVPWQTAVAIAVGYGLTQSAA